MDISTLAPTLLGGLLAIGGGFVGQWWSEHRATAREVREREHEREIWARGLRFEAHVQFLSTFDAKYKAAAEGQLRGEEPPEDWLVPVWDRLQSLRMVCEDATARRAEDAIKALHEYTYKDGPWAAVDWNVDRYLGAIRDEFQLSPITLMGDDDSTGSV